MNTRDSNKRAILRRNNDGSLGPNVQTLATTTRVEEPSMINKIIRAYKKDDKAKELRKEQKDATVLIYKEKIYLPEECIKEVISNHHDDPQHGHPGVTRTMELIARNCNAPGLKQHVM